MSEPTTALNQEPANRTAAGASTQAAAPATPAVTPTAKDSAEGRKLIRNLVALLIVFGAVFLTLYVWSVLERHPRTDDAAARANVVGIVPRVRGPIVNLAVQDNQLVKQGDLLFEIDAADYEQALDKAKSSLASLDEQIDVGRAQDEQLKFGIKAAEAGVQSASAQLKQLQTLVAQRPGAVAAVKQAELDLSYCKVTAPFDGRVINLNISAGAYASTGVPVFSILDTTKWYVVANFRERELRYMAPGSPATIYLVSAPNQQFRGKVQGIGWAVKPEGEIDLPPSGVPYVKRELNWVRVAQRFPVRIEVENPDLDLFRMGASAVAIIKGPPRK